MNIKRCLAAIISLAFLFAAAAAQGEQTAGNEADGHTLTRFYFSRGGYMVPESCEITLEDGGYIICFDGYGARPLEAGFAGELLQIIEECGIESWDGFRGMDPNVLDGEGFWLEMEYADGTTVCASGENRFPTGYFDAVGRLGSLFEREKMSWIAGEYRYEGEGFGGDFVLTLNAGGTYTFYEGPLSSYMGGGTWNAESNAIFLTEKNGLDRSFMFGVGEGELFYVEMGSDPFLYVRVADGERFIKTGLKEDDMKLFIGDTQVPVTWEENASVSELRTLLPLTVRMSMYGGFEQVGPVGRSIPRDDHETVTQAGDIVLYAGDQIVVFYGSNTWAYTRLGHVDLSQEEMAELLSHGDVILTIR